VTDSQFRLRLTALVTNVLNTYWDLSVAADNLRYTGRNHELADELLNNIRKQIAAGAVPAIDQVRAQSNLATQDQALHVAENNLVQRESAMKDVLSWHGGQDPELEAAHIVTVDPLQVPDVENLPEFSALMATARANRRDLAIARQQEEMAAITAYGTANGVLPTVRVSAALFNVGQAGTPVPGQTPSPAFIGGAGTALSQVMNRDFPNEQARITYAGPIHNTLPQADSALDQLARRQAQLAREKTATDLARDIALQRLTLLQASTRYHSAIESRKIIEQLLQGEDLKWKAGTSTVAAIVQARRDLANAQSTELTAAAAFVRAQVALDQALGVTLQRNNIDVEDALRSVPDGK
jgi:outer membrane protein TolC